MHPEHERDKASGDDSAGWSALCRTGGIAAFLFIAYSLGMMIQLVVLGSQPATATEAFNLLQNHRAIALLRLDLPTVVIMPLYYLVFLGLYAALKGTSRAKATVAIALGFPGMTLLLATPTALSMVSLSDKYAAATSNEVRAQLLAAGEAIMATDIWHGTGAILGGALVQCGLVIISVAMLRGGVFGIATAWLGIVMHALDLAHIVFGLFLPPVGVILMALAGPLYPIWFFLIGRRLFQLGAGRAGSVASLPVDPHSAG
jgi:hypothetical protein